MSDALSIWRPIPGFSKYEASDAGEIRRVGASVNLKTHTNHGGYLRVSATDDAKKKRTPFVHVLVCSAFSGDRPTALHDAAHENGRKEDCSQGNLRWKLPTENEADKRAHGTAPRGRVSAFREERVDDERRARIVARAERESFSKIARDENLHRSSVARIVRKTRAA